MISDTIPTKHWHRLADGRIQCDVCPRACKLNDDRRGGSTYCHGCGRQVIGRDWYVLTTWNLTENGRCRFCDTPCSGVFDGPPGSWGARRLPVRLAQSSG